MKIIILLFVITSAKARDLISIPQSQPLLDAINRICDNDSTAAPRSCSKGKAAKADFVELIAEKNIEAINLYTNFLATFKTIPSFENCRTNDLTKHLACLNKLTQDSIAKDALLKIQNTFVLRSSFIFSCYLASSDQKTPIKNPEAYLKSVRKNKDHADCEADTPEKVFDRALALKKEHPDFKKRADQSCHIEALEGKSCEGGLYDPTTTDEKISQRIKAGDIYWSSALSDEANSFTRKNFEFMTHLLKAEAGAHALETVASQYLERSILMNFEGRSDLNKLLDNSNCQSNLGKDTITKIKSRLDQNLTQVLNAVPEDEKGFTKEAKLESARKDRINHLALSGLCMDAMKKKFDHLSNELGLSQVKSGTVMDQAELAKLPWSTQVAIGTADLIPGVGMLSGSLKNTPSISGLSEAAKKRCSNYYSMFTGKDTKENCEALLNEHAKLRAQLDVYAKSFPELLEDLGGSPAFEAIARNASFEDSSPLSRIRDHINSSESADGCMQLFQTSPHAPTVKTLTNADEASLKIVEKLIKDKSPDFKASMLEKLEAICENPIEIGEALLLDQEQRDQFYDCGHNSQSTLLSYLGNDQKKLKPMADQECKDRLSSRDLAQSLICKLRDSNRKTAKLKELGIKVFSGGMDLLGALAPVGALVKATKVGGLRSFVTQSAKQILLGGAAGAGMGLLLHKVTSPEEQIRAAIRDGRSGFGSYETFKASLEEIENLKQQIHPAVMGAIMGSLDGAVTGLMLGGALHTPTTLAKLPRGEVDLLAELNKLKKIVIEETKSIEAAAAINRTIDNVDNLVGLAKPRSDWAETIKIFGDVMDEKDMTTASKARLHNRYGLILDSLESYGHNPRSFAGKMAAKIRQNKLGPAEYRELIGIAPRTEITPETRVLLAQLEVIAEETKIPKNKLKDIFAKFSRACQVK